VEVVAGSREHGVVLIAKALFEEVPAEVAVILQMADHGLDG
jgi:hypothetical protein